MKHLLRIFTLLTLVTLLSSCQKDGYSADYTQEIVGTWNWSKLKVSEMEIPLGTMGYSLRINFKSNGTWTGSSTGLSVNMGSGTYSISGDMLTIKERGSSYNWKIITLTDSQLIVSWDDLGGDLIMER